MSDTNERQTSFNVLLMISKRGFRHLPLEQKFISSQMDWVYTENVCKLAGVARAMMSFTIGQTMAMERSLRPQLPHTTVLLSNEGTRKHSATERMVIDDKGFSIDLSPAMASETAETNLILTGAEKTSTCASLGSYLNGLAAEEAGSVLANGGPFADFVSHLGDVIKNLDRNIMPLFMKYRNDLDGHDFDIVFAPKDENPTHVLRIKLTIY